MPIDVVQLNTQEINWLLDGYPLAITAGADSPSPWFLRLSANRWL